MLKVYQISTNLVHRELRNATFVGKTRSGPKIPAAGHLEGEIFWDLWLQWTLLNLTTGHWSGPCICSLLIKVIVLRCLFWRSWPLETQCEKIAISQKLRIWTWNSLTEDCNFTETPDFNLKLVDRRLQFHGNSRFFLLEKIKKIKKIATCRPAAAGKNCNLN